MRPLTHTVAAISLMSLTACASIVEGSTGHVNVATSPATNSSCVLTNSRGTVNTTTPSTAVVKKSRSPLDILCSDTQSGAKGQAKLESGIEPWDFGNILFGLGGIIGIGVDWGTGAAYTYPDSVLVPMTAAYTVPPAAPVVEMAPVAPTHAPLPDSATVIAPATATAPATILVPAPVPEPAVTATPNYIAPITAPVLVPSIAPQPAANAPVTVPVTTP